ncbi:hypothetical protein SARC_11282 [Sphaeroforma arctica JP610]|uniref:Uncharacterized protein n=1 Tax=Sphaeroforma arctica JP610 TaxID=667725 RepID=A0A0L0FJK8_9EUKA|nr:hypothetical protein SARC_11282 [Sphaeroforma arctica JP610]KNC76208.1 hypothetical protein SARC_11282 [Sphaeroforma arctica JP610]|eukprot:XP_014150110.1 hypothetical protein SARC_11282 [Sphaeroforma arctica JP610]
MFSVVSRSSSRVAQVVSRRSFFGSSKDPVKDAFASELKKIKALQKSGKIEKTEDHARLNQAIESVKKMDGLKATGAQM